MDDILARRQHEAARPRRVPAAAAAAAADAGANASLQDGEAVEGYSGREAQTGPGRQSGAGGRMERRNTIPQGNHQRHMPMEPLKLPIPRKIKEKRALFHVSSESREYEDMMTILTSSYIDTSSASCFTYCTPRLVHSELLEKEFVEKRKEMKSDGRTDKELEESYCFLLADAAKLPLICEKGLLVGQSWITGIGNPSKGVYLSRYSDLLQVNQITPGATGEIIIFKVMKGKVKSIYENMKNLLDPTPRFDSHICKNASKVTSLNSYRAFELTQQYFYEYSFDELRERPRQVCPYAIISFTFKGKDAPLPSAPLAPIRMNSHSAEGDKERPQFTVWTGDLVEGDRVLFQISLRSSSPPFLPHKLPEKLEIGRLMRLDHVTKLLPSELFSYNLYNSSQEVVKNGHCCSLLEVTDRSRSTTSVTGLLQELEVKRVVLVTPLTERGFLFLLSSVQMATPNERGENWKRCLHALFIFPDSRNVTKSTSHPASSSHDASEASTTSSAVMPRLSMFIPALHHALIKARATPPLELSAGVERQAREYFTGLKDGKVRQYPMGKYESKLDEKGNVFPAPKHHKVNMDGYLRSYLYNPAFYQLSVARARLMVEAEPEEPQVVRLRDGCGPGQREAAGKEARGNSQDGQTNTQKFQQDLVQTCKRNAENEVNRERGGRGGGTAPGRKRRLDQETAERALKLLKASQEPGKHRKVPVEGGRVAPGSLTSALGSLGLKDVDLREDQSELSAQLLSMLTGLSQATMGTSNQSLCEVEEAGQRESCPFDRLAAKLGLPTNCDIDLRKQEELEEQTAGSASSLEGFSPSSHSGEMNHHGASGRGGGGGGVGQGKREGGYEEEEGEGEIPWILIPITGLCSERYTHRDRNIPQDPRFQRLAMATSIITTAKPPRESPTPSPEPSPPPSPFLCPSPEPSPPPSPSQCPSPDPSPPPSPSQCPSPEPSPPPSPSQCPSPESSPPASPSQCPSPQPSPPASPSQCLFPQVSRPPSWCQSLEPNELSLSNKDRGGANEEQLAPTAPGESAGVSKDREEKPGGKDMNIKEPIIPASIQPSIPAAPERTFSLPSTERENAEGKTVEVKEGKAGPVEEVKETQPFERRQEEERVRTVRLVGGDEEQKRGSLLSPSIFTPTVSFIDSVVDEHLNDFSSEMQLVLQKEDIHYSSSHSISNTYTTAPQHTLQQSPALEFSPYVTFYNTCPPVEDYVSSLHSNINSVLTELGVSWSSHRPAADPTHTDVTLANSVSAFVSSIRAANINTGTDDGDEALGGEVSAADVGPSLSRTPALSRGGDVWPPPPPSHSVYNPDMSPQSHWKPQQSHTLQINSNQSPVAHNIRQMQESSISRTAHCSAGVEGGSSLAGAGCELALSGFSSVSKPLMEPSHPTEPASSPSPVSLPGPGTALSSLINQMQPDFFNNLVEIIKDVNRNSLQFYLHSTEPQDQVYEHVKEHLLKKGYMEQNPLAFLSQENGDSRLLVIVKNKDIAAHIHKIPGLVSLKRHPNVMFVGIDTLDDIRNNSYNELFVSGGCVVSHELILNPDFITHDRLTALLMLLEQHSSPESVWRWKIHCKTHKKLKEQSRFRRDAANLLDVLSAYQKRQIVEFLPYHHCDMMNRQSPDLDCLMELQARYTQYRHTVLLTEHHFENVPTYSSDGIIVANIKEILHDFTRLVGHHNVKDNKSIIDDMLTPKEPIHSLSACEQPQHLLHQSVSGLPHRCHLSDQLVPDSPLHSGKDYEDLRLAISRIRAERQAQQQQQLLQSDSQAELSFSSFKSVVPRPVCPGSQHPAPLLGEGGPAESVEVTPGRKGVIATLDFIPSAQRMELVKEETREDRAYGWRSGGRGVAAGDQRDGTPVGVVGSAGGNLGLSNSDTSTRSSNHNAAAVTGPGTRSDPMGDGRETAASSGSSAACPVEGDRTRDAQTSQEQAMRRERPPAGTGSIVTEQEENPSPVVPGLIQQHQTHLSEQQQFQQSPALLQQPPHSQQQQWGAGLLQSPRLPQFHNQPFIHGPLLTPLTALRGGLLGSTPVWPGSLSPASAAALVWGFPQAGRDFPGSGLLAGYHNPACQGNNRYRGGQRGGGFSGM